MVVYPAARLLRYAAAIVQYLPLSFHLVVQGAVDGAEAVHVLDLYLAAKLAGAHRAERDVSVAAEVALLHVTGADIEVAQDLAQLHQVGPCLLRRAHVWFADGLHQGNAGAVDVNQAVRLALGAVDVNQLGGILL